MYEILKLISKELDQLTDIAETTIKICERQTEEIYELEKAIKTIGPAVSRLITEVCKMKEK